MGESRTKRTNQQETSWFSGMMSDAFNTVRGSLWEGSWLQRQFQTAQRALSPVEWVKSAAESLLGQDFLRSALGVTINLFDRTPDNDTDDNDFVAGLKAWRNRLAPAPAPTR